MKIDSESRDKITIVSIICLYHDTIRYTNFFRIFSVCAPPPSLVSAYYLQPPYSLAIFLHDLLCNYTCSITGGRKMYLGGGGGTNGKDPFLSLLNR